MTIKNCPHCGGEHIGSIKCPFIEPCSVCGAETIMCCSDCAIESSGKEKVRVCIKSECRDKHERERHPNAEVF